MRSEQAEYAEASVARDARGRTHEDHHLRSCKAVVNYRIFATDGSIGHVHGLLVDEDSWAIRYLIVDTNNWWWGHHVLISPHWISKAQWPEAAVSVDLTREAVRNAPPYDAGSPMDRDDEAGLYSHYGRPGYWADEEDRACRLRASQAEPAKRDT